MAEETRMFGKRLALVVSAVALVVAVAGGASDSTGQTQGTSAGITYGGLKDQYGAWLRLDPGRRAIAALQIDWAIAPERCSNRKAYSSVMYAGYEEQNPISVGQDGAFKKTVVDRFKDEGGRYEETQVVSGKIADDVVTGSITSRVRVVKPSGLVVRCTSRVQRWRLVD
jgi:hypothetical protein